MFLYHEMKS